MAELRLGKPDLAREAILTYGSQSFAELAQDPTQAVNLYRLLKALCQNGLADVAAHLIDSYDVFTRGASFARSALVEEGIKANADFEPENATWSELLPLLHAAVSRGYLKTGQWEEARRALVRWKFAGNTSVDSVAGALNMSVPVEVANSLLKVAAASRHLPTVLEAIETLGAVGTVADDATFEVSRPVLVFASGARHRGCFSTARSPSTRGSLSPR
jgi:hypothetical protein